MLVSCGDKYLIDHMENKKLDKSNLIHVLWALIQNNFIDICGKIIQKLIVEKINKSKCISVLVDETIDDIYLALNSYHYVYVIWIKNIKAFDEYSNRIRIRNLYY